MSRQSNAHRSLEIYAKRPSGEIHKNPVIPVLCIIKSAEMMPFNFSWTLFQLGAEMYQLPKHQFFYLLKSFLKYPREGGQDSLLRN